MNRIFSAIANNEDQVLDQLNKDIDIAKEDGICEADQYTITASDDKIILHDKINDEDTEIINLENGDTTFSAVDTNGDPKPDEVLPLVTEKNGKDFSEMTDEELDETIELMSVKASRVKKFSLESLRTFAKGGWKNGKLFITIGDSDVAIDLKNKVAIVLDENLSTPIDPKKSLVDNLSAIEKFMKENGLKVFSESGASISDKKFSKIADLFIDLEEYIFGAQGDIKKSLQKFAREHKMDFKDAKEAAIMMIKIKDLTDDWGNLNEEEDANGVSQKVKDDLIAQVKKFSEVPTFSVKEFSDTYAVYQEGGSIGEKNNARVGSKAVKVIKTGLTEEEAKEMKKRWNKMLTPGEKKYYRISYKYCKEDQIKDFDTKNFSNDPKDWYVVGILVNKDGEEEVYAAIQPQETQPTKEEVLEFEPDAQDLKYFKVFANEESADAYRDGLAAKMGKTFSDDEEWYEAHILSGRDEGEYYAEAEVFGPATKEKLKEMLNKAAENVKRVNENPPSPSHREYAPDHIGYFKDRNEAYEAAQAKADEFMEENREYSKRFSEFSPAVAKMFNKKS
jgi:hypothetical protein